MTTELLVLIPIFFVIAIFYAAAGFGGGSSYLAILALFPLQFTSIRVIALLCNITVVSGSIYLFWKQGFIRWRKILPLVLLSIPFAYLGGRIQISEHFFFSILGFSLFAAALIMLFSKDVSKRDFPQYTNAVIGGGIGFLSGIVGIGGGIFLSPLLHLSKWNTPKIIAATTATFILVNSIAGLIGQVSTFGFNQNIYLIITLMVTVFIGGQIGSRLTIHSLSPLLVKKVTALLILFVSSRILLQQFGII